MCSCRTITLKRPLGEGNAEKLIMPTDPALEEQIKRCQAMTGEQRLKIALDMNAVLSSAEREDIRRQNPQAGPDEAERLLRQRQMLVHTKT